MTPITLQEFGENQTILAGQTKHFEFSKSTYFLTDYASHNSFTLRLNDGPKILGKLACGRRFADGEFLEKISVTNTHATDALSIRVTVGTGDPIDNFLNVLPVSVTPSVRTETPSGFAVVEVECTGLATPVEFVPVDCLRARIRFWTDGAATAYYGPDDEPLWTNEAGNQVGLSLDGATTLETCAAIYVTGAPGVMVRGFIFTY